jgi:riboflavin kinase/FMN adenylyltransferase
MQVYTNISELPVFPNAVVTIGTFDGVHQGHLQIIKQLISEARAIQGTPVVITFYPHPRQVIEAGRKPIFVLNTPEEKYRLLHACGIEHIVVVPFDKPFSEQPAHDYIKNFLVDKFHPRAIIIGYDHRFGMNREGNYQLLETEARKYDFKVKEIPEHVLRNIIISSTRIREALQNGDIDTANQFLGYPYTLTGTVVAGKKLGRTIGYPTANLQMKDAGKLVPGYGIYAVEVRSAAVPGKYKGMMSIGTNPTVNGTERTIEVNIFDFDKDIYGTPLEVSFIKRLRDEEKFSGLQALQEALAKDKADALDALKDISAG